MITPNISISLGENCELIVLDLTKYDEDINYADSAVYDFIIYNKSEKITDGPYIFNRTINLNKYYILGVEPIILPLYYDGWLTLIHIILPKKDSGEGYYFNGESACYKGLEISDNDLLTLALINNSPLCTTSVDFINFCFLEQCYIDLCKQAIEGYKCDACETDNDILLLEKIKQLRVFLLAIKIMLSLQMFEEAQEIIDSIINCNGLCSCCASSINIRTCNCS